jgi:hypothetical protein
MLVKKCGLLGKICNLFGEKHATNFILTLLCAPIISTKRYTADILDETKNVLLEAGMNRVLPKPEPMHAFQSELRTMIQRAAANEEV